MEKLSNPNRDHQTGVRTLGFRILVGLMALVLLSCSEPPVRLEIVWPLQSNVASGGRALSASDDANASQPGLQITVRVQVNNWRSMTGSDDAPSGDLRLTVAGEAHAQVLTIADALPEDSSPESNMDDNGIVRTFEFTDVTIPTLDQGGDGCSELVATIDNGLSDGNAIQTSSSVTVCTEVLCPTIVFNAPVASDSESYLIFGPSDDTAAGDGVSCGSQFEYDVELDTVNVPAGSELQLFVNDMPLSETAVVGATGSVTFSNVVFGNRGIPADLTDQAMIDAVKNTLSASMVNTPDGVCTGQFTFANDILVDCDGPSATVTAPTLVGTTTLYANQSIDDDSAAAGCQFDVSVDTDASAVSCRLVVNGDDDAAVTVTPSAGTCQFSSSSGRVSVAEGDSRFYVEVTDNTGNSVRTPETSFTCDVTACGSRIESPTDGAFYTTDNLVDHDGDAMTAPRLVVSGQAVGTDCVSAQVGSPTTVSSEPAQVLATDNRFPTDFAYLPTSASSQTIEINTLDEAGNVGSASTGIDGVALDPMDPDQDFDRSILWDGMGPSVTFSSPAEGSATAYNSLGTAGRVADLNTATTACDIALSVGCSEEGVVVDICSGTTDCSDTGGGGGTRLASATCTGGMATFTSVAVPSQNDGGSTILTAWQYAAGFASPGIGQIQVTPDCDVPVVNTTLVGSPLILPPQSCPNVTVRPATADEDGSAPGTQTTFFFSPTDTALDYTVTVTPDTGVVLSLNPVPGGSTTFGTQITFPVDGNYEMDISSTDAAGNASVCPSCLCSIVVEDLPTVGINPPDPSVDCDTSTPGLQMTVSGTSDTDGATVRVQVGAAAASTTTVSGGTWSVCAATEDGDPVTVTVQVTDSRGTATDTTTVVIDTLAPMDAVSTLACSVPSTPDATRRSGIATCNWTAVDDNGVTLTAYEVRCSTASYPASSDAAGQSAWWDSAGVRLVTLAGGPSASGMPESGTVAGFWPGVTSNCVMRGLDSGGLMSPLPPTAASVSNSFLTRTIPIPDSGMTGGNFAALGDINGDGVDDFIVGTTSPPAPTAVAQSDAYLVFGVNGSTPSSVNVTLSPQTLAAGGRWGLSVANLGDFNGDGINDFVISNGSRGSTFQGSVSVFFGRSATAAWPSTLDESSDADVTFGGTATFGSLGQAVAGVGDFDGDGSRDLLITEPNPFPAPGTLGRTYVVRGSTSWNTVTTSCSIITGTPRCVDLNAAATIQGFVFSDGSIVNQFGFWGAALGGDASGDMRADAVVVGNRQLFLLTGRAYSGSGSLDAVTLSTPFFTAAEDRKYALNMVALGNVNGGGLDFAAFDSVTSAGGGPGNSGAVDVWSGNGMGSFSALTELRPTATGSQDFFGRTIANGFDVSGAIGDLNGDGTPEILIGSQRANGSSGSVYLIYNNGATPSMSDAVTFTTAAAGANAYTAGFVGDVNNDGYNDFAAGDPGNQQLVIYY